MDTKKLRQKILDLAIRGKLVPQDPNDEPASVLLERIRAEKERLIKEGKIKRSKKSESSDKPHYENYELPSGWKYDLITNICSKIVDGDHNPPVAQKQISPYIMLSSKNINEDAITNLNDVRYLSKADFDISNNRTKVTKGDVLFTSVGSIGRTCIYDLVVPVAFQRSVTVMTTYIYNRYFKLFLDSPLYQNYVFENARGTAQKGFYINQIENSLIPIPPYNEQIKIVEITEKLLFFVKKIEEERNNIIENIYRIKSEILDLAISGKLVPQNSADEPAIELLRKINPAFKPCDNSHYENIEFDIPESWCWATIGNIFEHNTGKALNASNPNGMLLDYITTSNLYWDRFELSVVKQMPFTESEIERCVVTKGDLLVCEGGDVGRSAIWNYDYNIMIQNHIHRLRGKVDVCTRYFFYLFMYYKMCNLIGGKGVAIQGLSSRDLHNLIIPVPPMKEQHNIASSIDLYFSKLDAIAAELQ